MLTRQATSREVLVQVGLLESCHGKRTGLVQFPTSAFSTATPAAVRSAAVYDDDVSRFLVPLTLGVFGASAALPCTIVNQPSPREALKLAVVVFRGAVLKSDALPMRPEMRGRQRFVVTLRVTEYWKGNRGATVTLYDLSPGTDCMGAGLQPGKEYLIFASEEGARDHRLDADTFWYGWTDLLNAGTPMLQPIATFGGDLSEPHVRSDMAKLGRGKMPRQ